MQTILILVVTGLESITIALDIMQTIMQTILILVVTGLESITIVLD